MKKHEYQTNDYSEVNNYFENERKNLKMPLYKVRLDFVSKIVKLALLTLLVVFIIYLILHIADFFDRNNLPDKMVNNIEKIEYRKDSSVISMEKVKQIEEELQNNSNDKNIITDFTFFRTKKMERYSVITGLKYNSSSDNYPNNQWCYIITRENNGIANRFSIALKEGSQDVVYTKVTQKIANTFDISLEKLNLLKNECQFYYKYKKRITKP
jgi:hypothetical protein